LSTTFEASSSAAAVRLASRGKLLQVLGVWFGLAAAIGNSIGAGIVRTPGEVAQSLPNAYLFLGVWIIGGFYALFGASSLAELGAAIPRSGGQYNFARRALGDYAGFIVGWSDWLSTCGTVAAVSFVIGEYSAHLFPGLGSHVKLFAVAIIVVLLFLQWGGIRRGSGTQLITAAIKTGAFVALVVFCFLSPRGHSTDLPSAAALPVMPGGWPLTVAIFLALQAVVFTIDGWDGVIYFGEEVREPGRDVPRAIFGSVFSVMAIYLLLIAALLFVLPMNQIAGNDFALGTLAARVFGPYGDTVIRLIMIVSMFSCLNANQLFCTRTLHAMSCDGLFFRRVAHVNKGGTPALALFLSSLVGVLFVLGSFQRVIAMLSFFFVANYTISYASLFALRKKEPSMPRPYRAWGYPWTTGIALAASVLFLVGSILTDRKNAPLALAILVVSYPVYRSLKWVSQRDEPATAPSV
jgi:APA family basic amino acid/polyamine antiporter